MARPRSPIHPEKRARLLEIAQRMFLEHGYQGTSMAKLAEQAEVAANTLYWYFDDKDALLVEALNAILVQMVAKYLAQRSKPLEVQLAWLVQAFDDARSLVATVHTRAALSPVVAQWHERFHEFLESQFVVHFERHAFPAAQAKRCARITMYVMEGMVSHPCAPAERRELLKVFVSALET